VHRNSAQALAEMPAEMRTFEIASQAASLDLVCQTRHDGAAHGDLDEEVLLDATTANYDTICVSVAVVDPTQITNFNEAQSEGMSVAELAKKFSADPSASKGGVYGCFGPTSSSFSGVRTATASTPLNTFPTTPEQITYDNAEADLFVAPTKRTPTPFRPGRERGPERPRDRERHRGQHREGTHPLLLLGDRDRPLLRSLGTRLEWPEVFAPAAPSSSDVGSTTISNLGVGASTYK